MNNDIAILLLLYATEGYGNMEVDTRISRRFKRIEDYCQLTARRSHINTIHLRDELLACEVTALNSGRK